MNFPVHGFEYTADIVFCVEATAAMASQLDEVKAQILAFPDALAEKMEECDKQLGSFRVKLVVFRSLGTDGDALSETSFFSLPEERAAFSRAVNALEARGGGEAVSALEAIAVALRSDFAEGAKRRQVIVPFCTSSVQPLGAAKASPDYPVGLPDDIVQLASAWEGDGEPYNPTYLPRAGRLLAFVPATAPWTEMETWNRYWPLYLSSDDADAAEIAFDLIVGAI